jgi:hypothetical protein
MPKSYWRAKRIALAASLLLFHPFQERLLAQGETTSAIVGTVSDSRGGAIVGASVTTENTDNGAKRSALTDESGRFSFPQLKPGPYTVSVSANGFEPWLSGPVFSGLGQKQQSQSV